MAAAELERDDLTAAVGARHELGAEAEPEVPESSHDVSARQSTRASTSPSPSTTAGATRRPRGPSPGSVPLALGSMGIGIAATGAASGLDHGGARSWRGS
jgi:hypothetical protein